MATRRADRRPPLLTPVISRDLTLCPLCLQRVLGNESDDRVSINFFGDGTCNVGERALLLPLRV
jgi:hypothetical protein